MSAISWTEQAFAPWEGCTKVSRGCDYCYAEHWTVTRFGRAGWGPRAERVPRIESAWQGPPRWNRRAQREGRRSFVFCSHHGDLFDIRAPAGERERLWQLVRDTPALVWLMLTKRPQNFGRFLPADWGTSYPNVWLGVSAEGEREARLRLPLLCRTPAVRRFVSAEPLLGAVDLTPWLDRLHWVITGCESLRGGTVPSPRPTDDDWFRTLRDQ